MAFADLNFDDREIRQIGLSLARHTGAKPEQIFDILDVGKANAKMGIQSPIYRTMIKNELTRLQKVLLIEMLTEVAMADGVFEEREKEKIKEVARLAGLSGDEVRQAVEKVVKK